MYKAHSIDPIQPDCGQPAMEETLNLYADGELPFNRQAELFAHLASCDACRRTLDGILSFRRLSRQENLVVPPALDDAFFKRLATHKAHTRVDRAAARRPLWQLRWAVSLRAGVVAAVVVFTLGLLMPVNVQEPYAEQPPMQLVVGEEELVELPPALAAEPKTRNETLYVFYPGLTIEADKDEEP